MSSHQTNMKLLVCLFIFFISPDASTSEQETSKRYEPTWDSLDTRPLPQWFDDAKFGIFIHWGIYSVPSFSSEWFWYFWKEESYSPIVNFMKENYPPNFTYQDFARDFTAEFYNPEDWAEIFQSSGAKYVVLTSKHHEGYTLWPSKTAFSWNSMDVGPHRDLVGELANAIKQKTDLKFGLYHSLFEWFNPLYLQDKQNNYTSQYFVLQKTAPELYELVENYQPDIIWSDGSIQATDVYWRATEFIAWLYNDSPVKDTVVVNDRWGIGMNGKHGDFYTYSDRYNPGVLLKHKWENCDTIDKGSFGYRRNARLSDFRTMDELVQMLAETVSCGGNLLLNIGPTKDGIITPIFEERLRSMGEWLQVNGEAIYYSKPWTYQNDTVTPGIWYTKTGDNVVEPAVFAIVLDWPEDGVLKLAAPQLAEQSVVTLLGYQHELQWSMTAESLLVTFPNKAEVKSDWAWVLKIVDVTN
ncbi:alpha-L-fucosidase-like [Periplaneta americana]|uniref:alpha-L-fucosidase-like n=1 Tax=Periplaneta americana TaxID=6978 RepID=UPI0037E9B70D